MFHELTGEPTTVGCMGLLEELIRTSPADVFWLQDRWRPGRKDPRVLAGKIPRNPEELATGKPRRVLVWLHEPVGEELKLSPGVPADLLYEYVVPAGVKRPSWIPTESRVHSWQKGRYGASLALPDAAEVLPVDAVLMTRKDGGLVKACRKAGIMSLKIQSDSA